MLVQGNYTLSSFFTSASGPFNIILKNVTAKGNATVDVEKDGKVRTEKIVMDLGFSDMTMDFQNLGKNDHQSSIDVNCIKLIESIDRIQDSWAASSNRSSTTRRIWCLIQ